MKYTTQIDIDLPRSRVVELFDSVDNMYKWQPELVSFEFLDGQPGQVGSTSKLKYKMGKREVEMIETITGMNLPDSFSGTYDAKGVHNIITMNFKEIDENKTRLISENEFQFKGFMAFIYPLMKGTFKKQTDKYLKLFKNFAEKESV